jgi:hypothetical protein
VRATFAACNTTKCMLRVVFVLQVGNNDCVVYIAFCLVSQVVIANAYHHRTDALSSVVALVGIGGAMMGYGWLDSFAGLVCGWDYHGCLLAWRHGPEWCVCWRRTTSSAVLRNRACMLSSPKRTSARRAGVFGSMQRVSNELERFGRCAGGGGDDHAYGMGAGRQQRAFADG